MIGGDAQLLARWRWFGGTEGLQSYGVDTSNSQALAMTRPLPSCAPP